MIEWVFYTRGIAPRRGLGAAVGPAGGTRSSPARGGQGWSPRDLPDTCPGVRRVRVQGVPHSAPAAQVRGWPRPGSPGGSRDGARSDPTSSGRVPARGAPAGDGGCAGVRGFGLDLGVQRLAAKKQENQNPKKFNPEKKKKRAIFIPTFFSPFFFLDC